MPALGASAHDCRRSWVQFPLPSVAPPFASFYLVPFFWLATKACWYKVAFDILLFKFPDNITSILIEFAWNLNVASRNLFLALCIFAVWLREVTANWLRWIWSLMPSDYCIIMINVPIMDMDWLFHHTISLIVLHFLNLGGLSPGPSAATVWFSLNCWLFWPNHKPHHGSVQDGSVWVVWPFSMVQITEPNKIVFTLIFG